MFVPFWIAPYFHKELIRKLQIPGTKFVISMNTIIKKEQMELIVRFWDNQKIKVVSRYLNSQFHGHTRASDLLQSFKLALSKVNGANLIQNSMDGLKHQHLNSFWQLEPSLILNSSFSHPVVSTWFMLLSCLVLMILDEN